MKIKVLKTNFFQTIVVKIFKIVHKEIFIEN